jgi:hypothetical protein
LPLVAECVFEVLEPEQNRGERLAGLIVQLSRESPAFELLRSHDAPERVALHSFRQVDGDRCARGERLRQPKIVVGETGIREELVMRCEQADRATARDERYPETGARAEAAHHLVIDLGVVEHRVDPFAAAALDHAPALRRRTGHRLPDQVSSALSGNGDEPQLVGTDRKQHGHEPRIQELA